MTAADEARARDRETARKIADQRWLDTFVQEQAQNTACAALAATQEPTP